MGSVDDTHWKTLQFRQNAVNYLLRKLNAIPSEIIREREERIFQRARSRNEYHSFVARLVVHLREMTAGNHQLTAASPLTNVNMGSPMGNLNIIPTSVPNQLSPSLAPPQNDTSVANQMDEAVTLLENLDLDV